jgi:hypothetical protein
VSEEDRPRLISTLISTPLSTLLSTPLFWYSSDLGEFLTALQPKYILATTLSSLSLFYFSSGLCLYFLFYLVSLALFSLHLFLCRFPLSLSFPPSLVSCSSFELPYLISTPTNLWFLKDPRSLVLLR